MKRIVLFLIGVFTIISCNKEDVVIQNQINENNYEKDLSAPPGFEIKKMNSIEFNGGLQEIQLINDRLGYVLGSNNIGGYAEIFRTIDGGMSWVDLDLSIERSPINMFFLNEEDGFISCYGSILKTTDGGNNWTEMRYQNLKGNMYHIQKDKDDNLYAILSGLEIETVLIKSIDKGINWQVINDSSELDFTLLTFSFKIFDDQIYISGDNGTLIVTDLDGNETKILQTGMSDIVDLEIIDQSKLVISNTIKTIKSRDGGISWTVIYDRFARILNFTNSDEGLMILNKSYGSSDIYHANDVIAYTEDGGLNWNESEEATNTIMNYSDKQLRTNNRHILVFQNDLYELKKVPNKSNPCTSPSE